MSSKVQDKPGAINFNLDTYEAEKPNEPFWIVVKGKRLALNHPEQVEWELMVALAEHGTPPREMLKAIMSEEDYALLLEAKPSTGAVMSMIGKYEAHFGLGTPGEGSASPT